jgi:chorismate dehydratase
MAARTPALERRFRIGSVPYLNAEPLAGPLRDSNRFPNVDLSWLVPSRLIEALLRQELDVALVSAAAVLPEPGLRILPAGCVAARGAVRSIQVYSRVPLAGIRTLALDASSRSAVALTRLYFRLLGRDPEYLTLPPDLEAMLARADAALLIGNSSLAANRRLAAGDWPGPPLHSTDLGAAWLALTGLPFVYAVWAAPAPAADPTLTALLDHSLAIGLRHRAEMARDGARQLGIPEAEARAYLLDTIRYHLGPDERAGLARFCDLAREHGILPPESAVRYAEVEG